MDKHHNKKGFSGISSLTSNIIDIELPKSSESKITKKSSLDKKSDLSENNLPLVKSQSEVHSSSEKPNVEKSSSNLIGKWISAILMILIIVWFINSKLSYKASYNYNMSQNNNALEIPQEDAQEVKKLNQSSWSSSPLTLSNDSVNNNVTPSGIQSTTLSQDSLLKGNFLGSAVSDLESISTPPLKLTPADEANAKFKVVVKPEQANIRTSAERRNNILGVVMRGQKLNVINELEDYFLVKLVEGNGFIHQSVVEQLSEEIFLPEKSSNNAQVEVSQDKKPIEIKYPLLSATDSSDEKFKVVVKAIQANVRKSPKKADNILGIVKKGDRLSVTDVNGDYYLISTSSGSAFIHNSAVQRDFEKNSEFNNHSNLSDDEISIDNLPYEDQSAIGSACVLTRSEGAAAYRRCVKQQVDQLQGTAAVDISHLPYEDQSAIGSACVLTQSEGAAAYRRCVKQQVDQLQGTAAVDISHLPYEDQSAIGSACVLTQSEGAAAYRRCVKQQVDQLIKYR